MKTTHYPSDLTDDQFALLEPILPPAKPGGRPRAVNLHDIVDAICYVTRTGCQWRALPKDYGPWSTAYDYFRKWRLDGTWQNINEILRPHVRRQAGRHPSPRTASIDSQSVKAGGCGGETGYDGGQKVTGRKRHLLVDSLGLLLLVLVTGADTPDHVAADDVFGLLPWARFPRLRVVWADTVYATKALFEAVAFWGQFVLRIVRRPAGVRGWIRLPQRWVVERTFGWLGRYRRLSKEYERETESSEALVSVSMIHLMLRRLRPKARHPRFRYRLIS